MRYVVYGAGAVGGVIGGHLHLAGLPTTLVARGDHLDAHPPRRAALDTAEGRAPTSTSPPRRTPRRSTGPTTPSSCSP